MNQVIETFCLTLIHSVWQSALLYIIYQAFRKSVLKYGQPVEKRNLLLVLLTSQMLMFVATFLLLAFGASSGSIRLPESITQLSDSAYLTNAAFALYALVVMYKGVSVSGQWLRFKSLAAEREKAPVEMRLFVDVRSAEMGIRKKITVWLSRTISTPLTYGWLKPVILLPVALVNQLSQEEVETLILHELAHISSKDYLMNFLVIASEILFFFNPFILLLTRQIKAEREKNCDLQVIQFRYSPLLYAGTLLKAARYHQAAPKLGLAAVADKSSLMERIKEITGEQRPSERKVNPGTYAFVALVLLVVGLFSVSSLKTPDRLMTASVSESYAPNEVFSFVKEAFLDAKKETITEIVPAIQSGGEHRVCNGPKEPSPSPKKKASPSPVYVKADEPTILNNNYFTIPVTSKELIEKDVEITEEDPQTGVITTTGVRMTWTDSGWVAEPLWQTKLKKDEAGTLKEMDSTGSEGPIPFYEVQ